MKEVRPADSWELLVKYVCSQQGEREKQHMEEEEKDCGGGGLKSIRSSETLRIYRWKEGIQRDIESMEGASIGLTDR